MKYFRNIVLYLISAANDIWAIPFVLIVHLVWGSNLRLEDNAVCTNLKPESWPMNPYHAFIGAGWYSGWAGTAFGHAIVFSSEPSESIRHHELTHVRQAEVSLCLSLLMGLLVLSITGKIWLSYTIWSLGYALSMGCGFLIAWIRGEDFYFSSIYEEHAYAVGDNYEDYREW